jgi:cytochrome c biogenesis protein CcdA/thiol-disulfide isomerase/thioredoxin
MILLLLVFLGGVLTILSPCILPVLPFVFARSEQRFLTSGLPLLVGMAVTFAGIATLAAVGGAWAVRVNQYGRLFALVMLTVFAATLLSRRLADRLARPFVALGNRLIPQAPRGDTKVGLIPSLLLGVATGLLWAPCAGPILGLVLTGAAISGPNTHTTLLLFAYAAGAATSLAVAILAGGRVFTALKRSLGAGEWVRRTLGVAVLCGVAAIALGFDGEIPPFSGATAWLNSPALTPEALRGKVVLVDFWTYSCINCLRALPYVKGWYKKYKDHGLVVIGVHAPEFAFEKNLGMAVDPEKAVLSAVPGRIVYHFYARDLHLVLGPGADGKPVRFRVQLDGAAPGPNHGADTDASGAGIIKDQRLYQLIRQSGDVGSHVFSIEFLDNDVQAYSFTFG